MTAAFLLSLLTKKNMHAAANRADFVSLVDATCRRLRAERAPRDLVDTVGRLAVQLQQWAHDEQVDPPRAVGVESEP